VEVVHLGLDLAGQYRYPAPNPGWLRLHTEEILEPGLPIVDAHHHLWKESGNHYLLEDLIADVATGHRIVATVYVQCHHAYRDSGPMHLRPVGETEQIEAIRRESRLSNPGARLCEGIVGFADLLAENVLDEVLDAHEAASPGNFRGIRQSVSRDSHFPQGIVLRPAAAGLLSEPAFRRGVRALARRKLTFDAMLYHQQIPELAALARDVEEAPIILNHYGTPLGVGYYRGREPETYEAWRRDVRELARCPNVYVKLGGLGMIITGAQHHLDDRPPSSEALAARWRPYVEVCIEAFGARRCLFESNFPVDKAMYSYDVLWNAFKTLAAGASNAEKADLFAQTAARLYRLDLL
jgi:L-fuconolactonase